MNTSEKLSGPISLVLLALFFSTFGFFSRYLNQELGIFEQLLTRNGAALLCALSFSLILRKKWVFTDVSRKDLAIFAVRGIFMYLLGVALNIAAVNMTKVSNVTFISSIPFSAFWGVLLFGEKLNKVKLTALGLCIAGAFLISGVEGFNITLFGKGELLAIISGIFFSLGMITVRWHSKDLQTTQIAQGNFLSCVIIAFIGLLCLRQPSFVHLTLNSLTVALIAGAILFSCASLASYGFRNTNGAVAGCILTLESVFAVVIGYSLYHEIPDIKEAIGGIMICCSTILLLIFKEK